MTERVATSPSPLVLQMNVSREAEGVHTARIWVGQAAANDQAPGCRRLIEPTVVGDLHGLRKRSRGCSG